MTAFACSPGTRRRADVIESDHDRVERITDPIGDQRVLHRPLIVIRDDLDHLRLGAPVDVDLFVGRGRPLVVVRDLVGRRHVWDRTDRDLDRRPIEALGQSAVSNRWSSPPLLLTAHTVPGDAASELSPRSVPTERGQLAPAAARSWISFATLSRSLASAALLVFTFTTTEMPSV
jgi:hypothetical protein